MTVTFTNRQRISNTLANWDSKAQHRLQEYRLAGYLEALLQSEGKIALNVDLPYKSTTYKRMIFPGTYEVKESYPELMYRLATEYLMETTKV